MTSKAIFAAAGITAGLLCAAPSWSQHEGHSGMSGAMPATRQKPSPRGPRTKSVRKAQKSVPAHSGMKMQMGGRSMSGMKMGGAAKPGSSHPSATKPMAGMSNMNIGGRPGGQPPPMHHPMPMGQPRAGTPLPLAGHGDMAGDSEHAQATLQSIDQAAGALQDAQQSTDPSRIAAALARAQRALSQARDHVVMGAQAGAKMPAGHQMPMTAAKPAAGAHEAHAMPMDKANAAASPGPKGDPHAGHQMPMAGGMKMGGMKMGGMSMDGMMAMQGMLKESRKHSQAALQSLDDLGSALQKARQAPDRPQSADALDRAERALEAAREHLGRSQYSVETGGDLQRLEADPGAVAPHLGGDHEAAPVPGTAPGPSAQPKTEGASGATGHAGHGATSPPVGRTQSNAQSGSGRGSLGELPSLVRGTPGMPGAPGLCSGSGTAAGRVGNSTTNQAPSNTSGRGGSNSGGRTGGGSSGGGAGR